MAILIITMIRKIIAKEPILVIGFILLLISIFFVPIDRAYVGYVHFKTLGCLLSLMIALKGMEKERLLDVIAEQVSSKIVDLKGLSFILVFVCFISAMFMTNDVALIAIVPITLVIVQSYGLEKYGMLLVALQTLAANIGSSLTPIGNPQNLYLFMQSDWELISFLMTMLPVVLFGAVLLFLACMMMPKVQVIRSQSTKKQRLDGMRLAVYFVMFLIALAAVFEWLPYYIALGVIVVLCLLIEKRVLKEVDYSLLLTFVVIFMLVGNLARIDQINKIIAGVIDKDTFLTAVITSQIISNVPTALMLSGFTENMKELLLGVNVGGMGTLIASMASIISYKLYVGEYKHHGMKYLMVFTILNLLFLALSVGFVLLL